jgi:predicted ATPase
MDSLRSIRIAGFRAIEKLELELEGLTVLVGENGAGKSTVIEALELLAKAGRLPMFVKDGLLAAHGRPLDLFRFGASTLSLGVTLEGPDAAIDYDFDLQADPQRVWATVSGERLDFQKSWATGDPLHAIIRQGTSSKAFDVKEGKLVTVEPLAEQLVLSYFGSAAQPAIGRVQACLQGVQVHVPFDTTPLWVAHEHQRRAAMRTPVTYEPAPALERLGANLPNAFSTLRNVGGERWARVLEDVRAGLGSDISDVQVHAVGRGLSDLAVKFSTLSQPVFSAGLSDGQLSYLAIVALRHADGRSTLLAYDEPEAHLHPALLARATGLFEEMAKSRPVVLSTHSDALLNMLSEPAKQIRVCRLDEQRRLVIERLDPERLAHFRKKFGSIGELRREGLLHHAVAEETGAAP